MTETTTKKNRGKRGYVPRTTGARDSHKVIGIDCPSMNWEAAALKKGSRAETNQYHFSGRNLFFFF
jgi:hypothetical protein